MAKATPSKKALTLKELLADESADERIKTLSFEEGLKLLEELVASVETGSLPLDKAVMSYEKGVSLISVLRDHLTGAEEKLKVLKK